MFYTKPAFQNVGLNTRSSLLVPKYPQSLGKVEIDLTGGSIAKSDLTEVNVKLGSKFIVGPMPPAILEAMNLYRGGVSDANRLKIDFFDNTLPTTDWKEIGSIDLPSLPDDIFVEVVNTKSSGTPIINAVVGYTKRQPPVNGNVNSQLMQKILYQTLPSTGSTQLTWTPNWAGAKVKRVHLYAGTATINSVYVKRNNVMVHDNLSAAQNAYNLLDNGKVPQTHFYHIDFLHDNTPENFLDTSSVASLEFGITLSTTDSVTAAIELWDVPYNL